MAPEDRNEESSSGNQSIRSCGAPEQEDELRIPLLADEEHHHYDEPDPMGIERDDDDRPPFLGMLLYCSLFFFHGISGVTWGRFGIVYYNEVKHLSAEQIGILQGSIPLIALLSQPTWGYMADLFQSKKRVYIFCKFMSTIFLLALAWKRVSRTFLQVLGWVAGVAMFRSAGVLDSHALDFLGTKHRGLYGQIRMWASVSWGVGCIFMGYLTDNYGFEWNFVVFGVMMSCMLLVSAIFLPKRTKAEQARYDRRHGRESSNGTTDDEDSVGDAGRPRPKVLRAALCRLPVIFWLFEGVFIGAGVSLVDSFLFVYLQNDLGASTELCGWTVGVTVLFELPIFSHSDYLLDRIGHDMLFLIAMAAYSCRVLGYTLLTPHTVLLIFGLEILHGVTIACMWIASVDFAARVAPPEWSTTVQTVLSTAVWCVGGGLGPMMGGWVMQHYGAVGMYRGAAMVVGTMMLLHLAFWVMLHEGPHGRFLKKVVVEQEDAGSDNGDSSSPPAPCDGDSNSTTAVEAGEAQERPEQRN